LSSLFLALALGCTGAPMEPTEAESALSSETQALSLPPGLRPSLVQDIQVGPDTTGNTSSKGSYWRPSFQYAPLAPVVIGSTAWFAAHEESTGVEIWRTDGTPEGTRLLRELMPSSYQGGLSGFVAVGDTLYVNTQNTSDFSTLLWKSDGTAEGTRPLALPPGVGSPVNITSCAGQLFFQTQPSRGSEWMGLWKSDGTAEGTVQLSASVKVYRGNDNRYACANGTLFLLAASALGGEELWKSDGTPEGTVRVAHIGYVMAPWDGSPFMAAAGSRVVINALASGLLASDGTAEGTQLLEGEEDLPERFSMYTALTTVGDTVTFVSMAGMAPLQLWATDGTRAGTRRLMASQGLAWAKFQALGDTLLFSLGPTTYRSDGTPEGTVAVDELDLLMLAPDTSAVGAVLPDGRWLLSGREPSETSYDASVWVSDGTRAGRTRLQSSTGQGPLNARGFTRLGDRVLFWADDGAHGLEPWVTDGTPAGTRMVRDIFRADSSWPADLTDREGTLYFSAFDATRGRDLWKSDGTAEGTVLVKDLAASPEVLTSVQGSLFFFHQPRTGSTRPLSLWKSDGTEPGTVQVSTLSNGSVPSRAEVSRLGTSLVFANTTSTHGRELWKSDGTPEGTVLLKDVRPGSVPSGPGSLLEVKGTLFFTADDGVHGRELWKTDGTAEGTVLVKDVRPGVASSWPGSFLEVEGTLFFTADDGVHGTELWKSDGTAEGTVLVKNLRPTGGSSLSHLVAMNGLLFFSTYDGVHGNELWKSDGTAEGTVLVADIAPGTASSMIGSHPPVVVDGTLYFQANDGVHGDELWRSDGTAEGTVLVKDTVPGAGSGLLNLPLAAVGSRGLAFPAVNDASSVVLWMSDGTAEGTRPVDSSPRNPLHLTVSGPRLFFIGDEGEHGMELWSLKQGAFQQRP
jgi:ELWxxDGT repeat protein